MFILDNFWHTNALETIIYNYYIWYLLQNYFFLSSFTDTKKIHIYLFINFIFLLMD